MLDYYMIMDPQAVEASVHGESIGIAQDRFVAG